MIPKMELREQVNRELHALHCPLVRCKEIGETLCSRR